jgi:hypothetical protein
MSEELARMKQRRASTAIWNAEDDELYDGEIGVERTPGGKTLIKLGDGSIWSLSSYLGASNYEDADNNELMLKSAVAQAISRVAPMSVATIDYTTVDQHSVFIVPTGYRAIVRDIIVTTDSISSAGAMPHIQLGTASANDEIMAATQLSSGMNQVNETEIWEGTLSKVYAAGEEIQVGIATAGTSGSHTGTVVISVVFI